MKYYIKALVEGTHTVERSGKTNIETAYAAFNQLKKDSKYNAVQIFSIDQFGQKKLFIENRKRY